MFLFFILSILSCSLLNSFTVSCKEVINSSLNQTLGRTLVTSFTTLLVLFCLYFFGGEIIKVFALALIFGVIVGTYSSIYIAANILLIMGLTSEHMFVEEKEKEDFGGLP